MSTHQFLQKRRRTRKAVLSLHIISSVSWFGVDLALLALLAMTLLTDDGAVAAAGVEAVTAIIPAVVPALAATMLATGVVLGVGTAWGLITYKWVTTKLAIGTVLTVLVGALLLPTALSVDIPDPRLGADAVRAGVSVQDLLAPPLVSGLALILAVVLSIYRPGGRWRAAPARSPRR
ncbi:hypothetical protein AAFP35_24640 [Gordonia sp. CPCC 206044]|uniref:hypothetical protein n=1 Tax=Gordonia sp. CPCC 206044 TaxID=3140793 RepID=UPI003AF3EC81